MMAQNPSKRPPNASKAERLDLLNLVQHNRPFDFEHHGWTSILEAQCLS